MSLFLGFQFVAPSLERYCNIKFVGEYKKLKEQKRILFVVNDASFFLSHRVAIALAAKNKGYDVHIATALGDDVEIIKRLGFSFHGVTLSRSGINPFLELKSLFNLYYLFRYLKPDLIHLVTIKPVLYGGLIARILGVGSVVAAISGLGSVFVAKSLARKIMGFLALIIYKVSLGGKNIKVIFQNPDDKRKLLSSNVIKEKDTVLIRGSGVDLSICHVKGEPEGLPIVVMASRLLKEKGVLVFIEAVRLLKLRGTDARFFLVGAPDHGNPSSVTLNEIKTWVDAGLVEALGFRTDIPEIFSNSHIIVFPSFYGEGLPKVLIEAAACARPVITTDNPGCRDAIEENITGLLVPVNDEVALANAIEKLILDKPLRLKMGAAGRNLAEREFTLDSVISKHLSIYDELIKNNGK